MEINIYIIIAFGIIFCGFMIALFLALRGYGKAKGIKHYEEIRDELSVRKEKKKKPVKESRGYGINIGSLIGGFITILIGITLLPAISKSVTEAQMNNTVMENASPMAANMLQMVPIGFAVVIAIMAISIIWNAVRNAGLGLESAGLV